MKWHKVWMILTLSCDGAARFLSDAEDRSLPFSERLALQGHLLVCAQCRRYRKQLRLLDEVARQWLRSQQNPTLTALSEAAKQRIRARVIKEMGHQNE